MKGLTLEFEKPRALANRLKLGREEFCQRLLTTLILHAPYPKWNTRSQPSREGLELLRRLWVISDFGEWPGDDLEFVDEFELEPRTLDEKGGAPDYSVLWASRVWLIELKTEAGSHRHDQVPTYFELAHHHHPDARIDLTYLTPDLVYTFEPSHDEDRYAHVTWDEVAPVVAQVWNSPQTLGQREVVDGLIDALERLEDEGPSVYLNSLREGPVPPEGVADPLGAAMTIAATTAEDGEQRALNYAPGELEELLELRVRMRQNFAAAPPGSQLRHVMPWIWRRESGGEPLTDAGQATGREIRFSRYARVLY